MVPLLLDILVQQDRFSGEFAINDLNQLRALLKFHLRKKMPSFLPPFLPACLLLPRRA